MQASALHDQISSWSTAYMQDTRRIHAEEAGMIELELAGRERMRNDAEEHARAEDSGAVAAAQMGQQIASIEARLDALKQRLYFPPIKGFRFPTVKALQCEMHLYTIDIPAKEHLINTKSDAAEFAITSSRHDQLRLGQP